MPRIDRLVRASNALDDGLRRIASLDAGNNEVQRRGRPQRKDEEYDLAQEIGHMDIPSAGRGPL